MTQWRVAAGVLLWCAAAFAVAAALRYGLVEPAELTARCDAGAQDAVCSLRAWTIQAFVHQRIGWVALVLAGLASLTAWRALAAAALFVAVAGLVLYATELCAPAALLALLVFAPTRTAPAAASSSSTAQ